MRKKEITCHIYIDNYVDDYEMHLICNPKTHSRIINDENKIIEKVANKKMAPFDQLFEQLIINKGN